MILLLLHLLNFWLHDDTFEQLQIQPREISLDQIDQLLSEQVGIIMLAIC